MKIDARRRYRANNQGIGAPGLTITWPIQGLHQYCRLPSRVNDPLTESRASRNVSLVVQSSISFRL